MEIFEPVALGLTLFFSAVTTAITLTHAVSLTKMKATLDKEQLNLEQAGARVVAANQRRVQVLEEFMIAMQGAIVNLYGSAEGASPTVREEAERHLHTAQKSYLLLLMYFPKSFGTLVESLMNDARTLRDRLQRDRDPQVLEEAKQLLDGYRHKLIPEVQRLLGLD